MKKLENKVALITGAASGLGKSIATLFASEGAKIVAADINETSLNNLKNEILDQDGVITTVVADMSKAADID
ncbi:MAG: SDR family NAD(P)-dependent oxidoreductase, partial [Saprospiraceae bacterium]